jgi:hypothetical protein
MAQWAVRPDDDLAEEEVTTISDEEWEATLRESAAQVVQMTDEEVRARFDKEARRIMGISGEEFIRRFDAGEFDDIPDDSDHIDFWPLTMWIPLVR